MFTDQKPFTVTIEDTKRKWGGGFWCKLCGHKFTVGNVARFVFGNGVPGQVSGNFFVCVDCDGEDVLVRANDSSKLATKLAKQWDIYGPDWQRDMQREIQLQQAMAPHEDCDCIACLPYTY